MSLPLDLAYYRLGRTGRKLHAIPPHDCRDDLIFFKRYDQAEYYKRISGRFVFARKLHKHEINDFYFNNGQSFRGATIVERIK